MTEDEKQIAVRRNRLIMLVMFCFIALIGIRIINIQTHSPEYDEIWTVRHYVNQPVGKILTDVTTPNNHVLNSLGIKFFYAWVPHKVLAMRLPALLGFAGLFFLLLFATLKLLRNKAARGVVLAVVLLDGMILHYAETARGYSLQICFVFGLVYALFCYNAEERESRRQLYALMWLVCALGSCLAVSSGVIYVTILTGLWGLLYIPFGTEILQLWKKYSALVLAGLVWTVLAGLWYGTNYSRFAQGRANFGETFSSVGQFLTYCGDILWTTGLVWPLLAAVVGVVWFRREAVGRIALFSGGAVLLVLLSAMVTKGGPARTYLPLIPVAMFGMGALLDEVMTRYELVRKYGMAVFLAVLAGCAYLSEPRREAAADPELGRVFLEMKKMKPEVLVVYRPTDSYVMLSLFGEEARQDYVERLQNPELLMLLHDNVIGTMSFAGGSTSQLSPGCREIESAPVVTGPTLNYYLYRLHPVQPGQDLKGRAVLCFVHDMMPELLPENRQNWLKDNFAAVNGFFTRGSRSFCFAADGSKLNADELLRREQERPGLLFFRVVGN
ncbi:MAG: hypothetical protein J5806_14120 [Lentisphaeria bacterium]|nr:hypothetical protein [Lentisphaeria bacterium]